MDHPHPSHIRAHASESGFTIIEVLVAAMILAIVAAGSAVAFVGAVGDSGIQRNRSVAEALAQQNESQLRGYTVSQLANLSQSVTKTIGNQQYTIRETGTFVSDSTGTPSCTNPSADYLETTSTVTWSGMPANLNGVTVTGVITPTAGQISSSAGVLAVQVFDNNQAAIAGVPVSATQSGGSGSASGVTASNGCVLFADLPAGNYTVNVTPTSGTFADASTDQAVSASSPDQATNVPVSAGTTAASVQQFQIAAPGAAPLQFTDRFPTSVAPTGSAVPVATSPGVVFAATGFGNPGYVVCSAQDTSGCPAIGSADTSWGTNAWTAPSGSFAAQGLYPRTYAAYPGLCSSDIPTSFGGTTTSVTVPVGSTASTTSLSLPAVVVRLWSGTGTMSAVAGANTPPTSKGTEMAMPSGSELVITDTGCGEPYVGGPGVTAPSGDSALPVNSAPTFGGSNDIGVLTYPGMPTGNYTLCYQSGTKDAQISFANSGNGEVINIFNGSVTTTGTCAT